MTDNIEMDISQFAKISGIDFPEDETEMDEEATEFCFQQSIATDGGFTDEDWDLCIDNYKGAYKKSLIDATEPSFEAVGLDVALDYDENKVSIKPHGIPRDWEDVGVNITEIVDGYMGIYYSPDKSKYETLKEISSIKDDKELVERHLHWVKKYSELYGTRFSSPQKRFYDIADRNLRNFW